MDVIAQKRQEDATRVSEFAKEGASQAVQKEEDLIKRRQEDTRKQQKTYYENLRQGLSSGNLQDEQLKKLGLEKEQRLYGVDPTQYLQYQDDPTQTETTTPEQLARYNALLQMKGTPNQGIIQDGAEFYNTGEVTGAENLKEAIQSAQTSFKGKVSEAEKQRAFWERARNSGSPTMKVTDYENVFGIKIPVGYRNVVNPDYTNAQEKMNQFEKLRNQLVSERESFTKL